MSSTPKVLLAMAYGLLSACSFSSRVTTPHEQYGGGPFEVSITHATLDKRRRAEFDRYSVLIHRTIAKQPGLVSHAVRRELFGSDVWTYTVWRDAEAREAFVRSSMHRAAMAAGRPAMQSMSVKRWRLTRDALPRNWQDILNRSKSAADSTETSTPH